MKKIPFLLFIIGLCASCGGPKLYKKPQDFVIATGKQYTVKHFINLVCKQLKIKIKWKGKGLNEKAYDEKGDVIIRIDKNYFRPAEVDILIGDPTKIESKLNWKREFSFEGSVNDMCENVQLGN